MIHTSRWLFAGFFLGLLVACNPQVPQEDRGPAPRFDRVPNSACPFFPGTTAPQNVECGYVVVKENRNKPDGRNIKLAVALIHKTPGQKTATATINLEGGPGGTSAWRAPILATTKNKFSQDWLATGDVIVYDQRGVGKSLPSLSCPYPQTEAQCFQNVSRVADPGQYTTRNSAADIADIASVLGYSKLKVYGSSYGTQLAQRLMRDHPEKIDSVVLDGVVDPEQPFVIDGPGRFSEAFLNLNADCQQDNACKTAYGNLLDTLKAVLQDQDTHKIMVTLLDDQMRPVYDQGQLVQFQMTSSMFLGVLRQITYSERFVPQIPALLQQAQKRQYSRWSQLVYLLYVLEEEDDFSEAVYNSVLCSDIVPFTSLQAAQEKEKQLVEPFKSHYQGYNQYAFNICAKWPVPASDAQAAQRTPSALPTLLLSGRFDPITPESQALGVAQALSNKRLVYVRDGAHGVVYPAWNTSKKSYDSSCGTQIMRDFLLNPQQNLARPCTETPVVFVLPGQVQKQGLQQGLIEALKDLPLLPPLEPLPHLPFR
ncbi:alpha/beta hydrolase [Deinococcus cellulosilyticus]|uniref:prolyl aminopeptidase n=1 Tax=Deinococcus cellulosilyticus (strain DSM 18568 / NBRC 106333 / KACC 11606 / 5516J-15) TaxID=1223518 RepID=A0A511N2G7_DEIC1|nr:alpha/beta fold hydrolase [Deinococcus cellulosilyticus]GEM47054.1 transporter [Deinococcus cellulosilyticus NBRC 106333 = KACC 11606]